MEPDNSIKPTYSFQVVLAVFVVIAPLINLAALFEIPSPLLQHIVQIITFLYVIVTPGLFLLPFLSKRKFPFALGITLSVALSIFTLMFVGLGLNTFLPMMGMQHPLSTIPLLLAFDTVIFALFVLSNIYEIDFALQQPHFNRKSWFLIGTSLVFPLLAIAGALRLNNGGSTIFTMIALALVAVFVPIIMLDNHQIDESVPPILLYIMALSLLLMNSMRGWFITGHDILLEYHVFILTDTAHLWKMAFYQDPYNACLSLTILPTYLQTFLHINPAYIFKFFTQFIGALPVVIVYYLAKQYVSDKVTFLTTFLYITFPTFMVDMPFLNRQGIAFLFFGAVVFIVLSGTEYFNERTKMVILFLLGTGMVFSHYSTSYIAVPLLIATYIINKLMRLVVRLKKPQWLFRRISKLENLEMYQRPTMLKLSFVIGLLVIMVLWSTVITKTSTSLLNTIQQIGTSLKKPFSLDEQTGPAKYSILSSQVPSPDTLFKQFVKDGIQQQNVVSKRSEFYPLALTQSYPTKSVAEYIAPLTPLGATVQSIIHVNLSSVFNFIKQAYAKILQVLLVIGLIGLGIGYSFKKQILREVPIEFIALSIAGIVILIGQTVLPASAIDYGLLRLFQQNLTFLALPIFLGLLALVAFITPNHKKQLMICTGVLLFFFLILSGFVTQLTGGARPLLPLNNDGLYYDSYYTHAEEVASAQWLAIEDTKRLPIQAAHFSDIKMLAYGRIASYIELLPETTKKDSYVYLNYDNVKTSNILEIIDGYVVYYHFPIEFLNNNKNLIYNNGGSIIYH